MRDVDESHTRNDDQTNRSDGSDQDGGLRDAPLAGEHRLNHADVEKAGREEHSLDAASSHGLPSMGVVKIGAFLWLLSILAFVTLNAGPVTRERTLHLSTSHGNLPSRSNDYVLDPQWDFDAAPTRREYHWTIQDIEMNPDGVYRPMILINNQFPGPLIECNEGDTLVIHVDNKAVNATSIHWHGMYQNGTNWMDGTVGVTQCPIAPGTKFTYEFKVEGQSGTYWYHGHQGVQASDGLVGPLIVHSKDEKRLQNIPYATDRVVMVQDHYYDLSGVLLMDYLQPDRENAEPVPDSALINGRNIRNCDDFAHRKCDNASAGLPVFNLSPNENHRLRFINVGAFAEFQIQVDEHEFAVTEVDGTDVLPVYYHRLNINPAQRYSIILSANITSSESYWLRARMVTTCFAEENPDMQPEVRAIVQYTNPTMTAPPSTPSSKDWAEVVELECRDMNTTELHPVLPIPAPPTADKFIYLRSNFEIGAWRLSRGFFNQSSWRAPATSPSLHRIIDGYAASNDSSTHALTAENGAGINAAAFNPARELVYQTAGILALDVLVSNFDDGNHPLHLHGYKYFVLAQGHGYPPADLLSAVDLSNPLRRDTASVEAFGWILIRFVADNPGVWAFHCHISWHTEAGLLMQFLTRAEVVGGWTVPEASRELCGREGVERGRGPEDEIWFGDFGG